MYMMIAGRGCYNFYFLISCIYTGIYTGIYKNYRSIVILEALLELYWDVYIYIYMFLLHRGLYNYYIYIPVWNAIIIRN